MKKIYSLLLAMILYSSLFGGSFVDWTEDPTDPIYNPGRAYYPSVIYDANKFGNGSAFYKMWYGSSTTLGLAYSNDGITWTTQTLTGIPNGAQHPDVLYDAQGFGGGIYTYKLWYWDTTAPVDSIDAVKFTQSTDGVNWITPINITQNPLSPLVTGISTDYFYHIYGPGEVLYFPENTLPIPGQPLSYPYVMYFDTATEGALGSVEQTGLAYSTDGLFWTRYGTEPVLIPSGNINDWDGEYMYQPAIVIINDVFHAYYSGSNGQPLGSNGNTTAHGIGYASSVDGINWTKAPNPIFYILDGVAWRNDRTYACDVIFDPFCSLSTQPHTAKMWFTGANSSDVRAIGYATIPCPNPLSPAIFTGIVRQNIFLNRTEYVLIAQWPASISDNIVSYHIYHDGTLIANISASSPLVYTAYSCSRFFNGYTITAVDSSGSESLPVALIITSTLLAC